MGEALPRTRNVEKKGACGDRLQENPLENGTFGHYSKSMDCFLLSHGKYSN
jgi:hypothetical protein